MHRLTPTAQKQNLCQQKTVHVDAFYELTQAVLTKFWISELENLQQTVQNSAKSVLLVEFGLAYDGAEVFDNHQNASL